MVVYDVTSDQSFDSCAKWLERVKAQKPTPELPLPSEHRNNKLCTEFTHQIFVQENILCTIKILFKIVLSLLTKFLFKKICTDFTHQIF